MSSYYVTEFKCLLGIVNDLLKMLEIEWGVQMESFYTQNGFKKGGSPGMVFVGKYLREIMLEPNLAQLKLLLGDEADVAIDYLRATRELYDVCVRQHLDESYDYEDKIEAFREAFNAVHDAWGVPETVKVHIMCDHVGDYFAYTGNNKIFIES